MLDREQALALLNELGPEKHLIQHALASEAVMRALARHLGEDEEVWGLTGLLHDLDYPLTHEAVSYTHLDVYKRQAWKIAAATLKSPLRK